MNANMDQDDLASMTNCVQAVLQADKLSRKGNYHALIPETRKNCSFTVLRKGLFVY